MFINSGFIILLGIALDARAASDDNNPSMELLEFLGSWDNGHGEWVDPTEFADDSFEQLTADYVGKKK